LALAWAIFSSPLSLGGRGRRLTCVYLPEFVEIGLGLNPIFLSSERYNLERLRDPVVVEGCKGDFLGTQRLWEATVNG